MAIRWNPWVWLECIGIVSGCCCKEVYRFPQNITFPYSTCISSFFAAASLLPLFINPPRACAERVTVVVSCVCVCVCVCLSVTHTLFWQYAR